MGANVDTMSSVSRAAARVAGLAHHGMPESSALCRGLLAAYVARKAIRRIRAGRPIISDVIPRSVIDAALLGASEKTFGADSMIRGAHGFYPHSFLPEFDAPHFDEAVRRMMVPGLGPNVLYLSLTAACPSHCRYCFAGAGGSGERDPSLETFQAVASKIAELRVPVVNISGGEPMARYGRLLDVVRLTSAGSEVRMFTSGFGLTAARLGELRRAGLKGVFVSLDTADADEFDSARGKRGAFQAAVEALRLCARSDMLTFVNCVVDRSRFHEDGSVERFLRFIESIDARIVVNFLPQLATGRGADAESFRRPEECAEVAALIVERARVIGRPVCMLFGTVDELIGCPGAGGKLMNIDVEGNVTVCISRAALGNIIEEPFEQIYDRFVEHCAKLKVGFFCCRVNEEGGGALLSVDESVAALGKFFHEAPDSTWQRVLDRYGWIMAQLPGL